MKRAIISLLIPAVLVLVWLLPDEHGNYPAPISRLVGQVFRETVTPESLKERYTAKALTILLVPGHDPDYPGAIYGNLREADLTLDLAARIKTDLERSGDWRVLSTRDFTTGKYQTEFASYFERERAAINSFRSKLRAEFASLIVRGDITPGQPVYHNFASAEVSTRLYGINRWSNDHQVDLTLHIHFNDYPGRRAAGKYSGFSIYIPERQLPNSRASRDLAEAVQQELAAVMSISDFPGETGSPIEDQELIAIGANASRATASFLVEYGYLAESQFHTAVARDATLGELSLRTVRGLEKYFKVPKLLPETALLPYTWRAPLQIGITGNREVLALQTALHRNNFYPPGGKNLHDCPINGNFGPCVEAAVIAFQLKNSLSPVNGIVAGATLAKLNDLYSKL